MPDLHFGPPCTIFGVEILKEFLQLSLILSCKIQNNCQEVTSTVPNFFTQFEMPLLHFFLTSGHVFVVFTLEFYKIHYCLILVHKLQTHNNKMKVKLLGFCELKHGNSCGALQGYGHHCGCLSCLKFTMEVSESAAENSPTFTYLQQTAHVNLTFGYV